MKLLKIIIVLLVFLIGIKGKAQEIRQIEGQRFEFSEIEHGANNLLLDSNGYLWIGTNNGIAKYNGYTFEFTMENPMDSSSFIGNRVLSISEDQEGAIWVGTNTGLNYKAPGTNDFVNIPGIEGPVYAIIEVEENKFLLSHGSSIVGMSTEQGLSNPVFSLFQYPELFIHDFFLTADNRILGLGSACFEFLNPASLNPTLKPIIENAYIKTACQREDGFILMASDSGFFILDKNLKLIEKRDLTISSSRVALHFDRSGRLWIGADNGVTKVEIDRDFAVVKSDVYHLGRINAIVEDASGNLIFGNTYSGIYKLGWNYSLYNYFSLPPEFENVNAFKFLEDKNGDYWISTFKNLLVYHNATKEYTIYRPEDRNEFSIPHGIAYGLLEDKDSNIWVATGDGVARFDREKGSFTRINVKGLAHHLVQASDGRIWFISDNILFAVDPESLSVRSYKEKGGENLFISHLYIDETNLMWAWNNMHGLQKFSLQNDSLSLIKTYPHPDPENGFNINWIEGDKLGRIWISQSSGVSVIDKQSGKLLNFFNATNSLLQQDGVYEIIKDQAGNMWLKQAKYGSISINPADFSVNSFNPPWLYNPDTKIFSCVASVGIDGKLFADGRGEFCIFYPDSSTINPIAPNVILEELKVNNQGRKAENLRLNYKENNLTFAYCGLHFDNPTKNRYSYYLEGLDNDWIEAEYKRQAVYSALRPGKYKFFGKACNSDGIWSEPVLLSTVQIMRPWWGSIPLMIFYVLLLATMVYLFYRIQLRRKLAIAEVSKLNEIDEFKNRFFANISHEFRTPLTVISGLTENLEGKAGKLVRRNTDQILTLVDQILELSKIEANSVEVQNEEVDILSLSKYILYSYSSLAEEKMLDLQFFSEEEFLLVNIDPEKYTTILQNLLSNAIKFTPGHGKILVGIKKMKSRIELLVSDTGVGIYAKDLDKIFERYYQAENQQAGMKGTGIGLALTKQLIHLMKGEIKVTSTPGKGTTFTVNLPGGMPQQIASASNPTYHAESIEEGEDKIHILLIEDNVDVCIVIRDLLQANYEVSTADNGIDGVTMAIENIPDIIISDVKMPGRDGLELTKILKEDKRTSHIPIILLTAKADVDSRLEGLTQGAAVYLQKPFNNRELLLHIQNLLKHRETLRSKYGAEDFKEFNPKDPEDKFISSLRELIYENLSDDTFGIGEICKNIGVSRTQLHRKLTALTGKSISIYVRDLRLAEGKKLLKKTKDTVAEIAYTIGFKDPNYFTRLFAEKYGFPPSQERDS